LYKGLPRDDQKDFRFYIFFIRDYFFHPVMVLNIIGYFNRRWLADIVCAREGGEELPDF
jgi:hypothetical protein